MRKALLATVAVVALIPATSRAEITVTDIKHTIATTKAWAVQAGNMVRQLAQLQAQYNQIVRTYNAIAHATDLNGITMALGGVTRTYLPEASETLSTLGAAARFFDGRSADIMHGDMLYLPVGQAGTFARSTERWLSDMEKRTTSTANAKGIALKALEDMQNRVTQLAAAQRRLQAAPDGTEVAAVHGLISVSQANLAAHGQQLDAIRLTLAAEERVERQRTEQRLREGSDHHAEQTAWAVGALGAGFGGQGQTVASAGSGW